VPKFARDSSAQAGQIQAAEHALHAGLDGLFGLAARFVHGSHDEGLKHLDVGLALADQAGRGRGINPDPQKLLLAIQGGCDSAPTTRSLDYRLFQLALDFLLHVTGLR
jgi:hypothetical protein